MISIKTTNQAIAFTVYVQPRSSKAAIVGSHLDMLKIKLTAPPVDGAANKQCLQVLAKALALPQSWLTIVGGRTSRRKQISILLDKGEWDVTRRRQMVQRIRELSEKST